jgi:hypothetical protein
MVLIETADAWYARDLVRNDPWLRNVPKVMWAERLNPDQVAVLKAMGSVVVLRAPDLARLGLTTAER